MAVNKVEYAGIVLLDLTSDTVSANKMLEGTTAHSKDGSVVTGTIPEQDWSGLVIDTYSGYARVTPGYYRADVSKAIPLSPITITSNGFYIPDTSVDVGFSNVLVDVPGSTPVIESKTITSNGIYNVPSGVDGFDPVIVNVPTGGITKETLWTNNDPTKSFASQTVTLNQDASNFDLIEVKWNPSTTATNTRSTLFDTTYLDVAYSYMFGGRNVNTGGSNNYSRNAYLTASNTMSIGTAYRLNSTTTQNTAIIPIEIIGWKL